MHRRHRTQVAQQGNKTVPRRNTTTELQNNSPQRLGWGEESKPQSRMLRCHTSPNPQSGPPFSTLHTTLPMTKASMWARAMARASLDTTQEDSPGDEKQYALKRKTSEKAIQKRKGTKGTTQVSPDEVKRAASELAAWDGEMAHDDVQNAVRACASGTTSKMHVIPNALPAAIAEAVHTLLKALPERAWCTSNGDDDDNTLVHSFAACAREDAPQLAPLFDAVEKLAGGSKCSLQLARYSQGDGIAPHDDMAEVTLDEDGETYERRVAVVLHLAKGNWHVEDGGCLVDRADSRPVVLPPVFNRFVAFTVPRLHEVTAVTKGHEKRFSLFGWVLRRRARKKRKHGGGRRNRS